ncbi:MAG: AAA family ATPase [[Clostridium] leptum]
MTPIRLKMQAFGPYQGAVEIAFSGLRGKLFLITGSTGGGKTTILDAICFALFCRATGGRRTWQDMRNLSAGEDVPTVVDFEFSLGEEQYRFQRSWRWHKVRGSGRMEMRDEHQCSRRNGEQWELLASGAESRVREYAQRLLGLTCEQFSQVIVLPQGEFRKLLLSNSTEKSKIFQTLFQTEKWERITKCAQSMAEDLEQRCGGLLSARQAVLESEGVQASEELELLRKATEEEYEQSIAAAQKTENDLENISNIIQKVNRLKETETVFRRLQKQLAQAAAEKRALEQKRQEAVKAAAGLARLEEEKAVGLQLAAKHQEQMETLTKLKSLEAEKERLEKEIASQKEQRLEWEQKALSAAENVERGRAYLRELNDKLKALPEASRSFQELKTAFELLKQWEEGKRRLSGEQSALQKAEEILEQSRVKLSALQESLERAQQKAREDMAGHLASGLRDGEPCPVCGAVHHPSPASLEIGVTVTPEEEKRLKRLVKEAQEAFTSAQGAFTKHQGQRELLEKNVRESERRIADFPYPPEKLPALLAAAEKKLAGLQKAGELLPQGEKRLAQRENEEKTAKLQADRSKERQAQWENKLSAVSAEISSLWGTLPEERQGQSLDQAEQGLRNSLTEVQARLESLRKKIQETQEASAKTGEALAAAAAGERALRNQTHEAKEQWEAAGGNSRRTESGSAGAGVCQSSRGKPGKPAKTGRLLQKRKSLEQAAEKSGI